MAMTINPASDHVINQHNQPRPGQEGIGSRDKLAGATPSPLAPVTGRNNADSVALSVAAENLSSARSQMADFDQAQGALAMLKAAIQQQAGIAIQTQANITPETALALLAE